MSDLKKDISALADRALYDLCKEYGGNAKKWTRKFAVLLPEVFKRGLYKRRGFISIYEFAAKVAGMGHAAVDQILSLDRTLEGKPALKALVEEYGWSKVRVVACYATKETEEMWADKVKLLSKSALEVYTRGIKMQDQIEGEVSRGFLGSQGGGVVGGAGVDGFANNGGGEEFGGKNPTCSFFPGEKLSGSNSTVDFDANSAVDFGTMDANFGSSTVDFATLMAEKRIESEKYRQFNEFAWSTVTFKIDPETELRLRLLKQKIEKEKKEKISFGQLLKAMIEKIEGEGKKGTGENGANGKERCEASKVVAADGVEKGASKFIKEGECVARRSEPSFTYTSVSRYIPAEIKKYLEDKYGSKCGFPGCSKPAEVLHHTKRFSLYRCHDPSSIVPLCKDHHDIAHGTFIEGEKEKTDRWLLNKEQIYHDSNFWVDERVREVKNAGK